MLKARMLVSAIAVGVTIPAAAHAQIPQVPEVPEVPPVPEVPVPDLPELPPVPTPPPAPELPAPPLPAPSGGGGGGAPSGGGSGSSGAGGGSAPAPSTGGGGAPSGGGGSSAGAGGGTGTTRSRTVRSPGAERESRTPAQRRRAERRLRRTVARLDGCLDELAFNQRRVLELRAGVGAGPPQSRRGVARALDVPVVRVRRLERRGLRSARALARADNCGSAAAGAGPIALPSGPSRPDAGGPITDAPEASAGPASGGAVDRGASPSGGGFDSGGVRGETSELAPPTLGDIGRRGKSATGTSLWVAAGLMLLAALAGFATPALGDRLRRTSSAGHP
jgi:hypothetical protein